jgi:carbon monoxide dehydrogenase subunit G
MLLEHRFAVLADPDTAYAFLIDVNRVAGCIPGVLSVEERDPDTFLGTLKVKVGPIGVTYRGTAVITSRDPLARRATVNADGTEGVGAGRVKASAVMIVEAADTGSMVSISTDLAIAGRLAQFGRSVIEGVAKRIVGEMADCIRQQLEAGGPVSQKEPPLTS